MTRLVDMATAFAWWMFRAVGAVLLWLFFCSPWLYLMARYPQ